MAEKTRTSPHGDPLRREIGEENRAQRQSDAPPDANRIDSPDDFSRASDRADGRGSTANGIPAFDEEDGRQRRRQYDEGADLVSGTD